MRSAVARITLKIIELLGCVACFIAKVITDLEARRVFLRNQKFSREWSLVHNVTWSTAGNTFANITYGGFSLITTLMLISRCIDANSRPSLIEKIFLIVGMLCFFAMGGLVLAAFDQVPWELHDNSIILGCLSFFVALVMLYDLSDPMARHVTDMTQTDNVYTNSAAATTVSQANQTEFHADNANNIDSSLQIHHSIHNDSDGASNKNNLLQNIGTNAAQKSTVQIDNQNVTYTQVETIQSKYMQSPQQVHHLHQHKNHQPQTNNIGKHVTVGQLDDDDVKDITRNGHYHRSNNIDIVHMEHLPQAEQPVFERVLLPEKKRPTFNKVTDSHATATVIQTVHSPDGYIESHIRSMDYLDDNNINDNHNYNNVQKRNQSKYGNLSSSSSRQQQQQQKKQQQQQHVSAAASTVYATQQQRHYHNGTANGIGNNHTNRTIYAKPSQQIIYKTNQSHAYVDNSNLNEPQIDKMGPTYRMNVVPQNSGQSNGNDLNRYKDAAPIIHDQYSYQYNQNQPMMVIRNYNSTQVTSPKMNRKRSKYNQSTTIPEAEPNTMDYSTSNNNNNNNNNMDHRQSQQQRNLNNNSTRKYGGIGANGTRSVTHHQHNQCCQNDSDESVDFRKMNAAMRPGYVASAAKMWDQRATENSNELNTIV